MGTSTGSFYGCPMLCAPGFFGNQTQYTDGQCSGECPVGHACVSGTSTPQICKQGAYSSSGSVACFECGLGSFSKMRGSGECTPCSPGSFSDAPGQSGCDQCEAGGYCEEAGGKSALVRQACPPGSFSNETGLSNVDGCLPTLPGFYSPKGSIAPTACGAPSFYCPGDGGAPLVVADRHETYSDGLLPDAPANLADATTRTSQRLCSDGKYCQAGLATDCVLGSYCVAGEKFRCPAGTLGNATGLSSPQCGGLCPMGSWCAAGSTAATQCDEGTYSSRTGLGDPLECSLALPGYFSVAGAVAVSTCRAGTFTGGLRSAECEPCTCRTRGVSEQLPP